MVPEHVPKGGIPDLAEGALVGRDKDVAYSRSPFPSPLGVTEAIEAREPASGPW